VAGIRDLKLGRISLPTLEGEIKEAVGGKLEPTGQVLGAGTPEPRPFALSIPIHCTPGDTDLKAAMLMRRQVRALLDNPRARLGGLYMAFAHDPELDGWLVIGSGEIEYAEGGITHADFKLALSECYRVGQRHTHRPGYTVSVRDRRLSTTPRDRLGTLYSTDFAAAAMEPQVTLPIAATDLIVNGSQVTSAPLMVGSQRGAVPVVAGPVSTVSYRLADPAAEQGDVLVRAPGYGMVLETNEVANPHGAVDLVGWAGASGGELSRVVDDQRGPCVAVTRPLVDNGTQAFYTPLNNQCAPGENVSLRAAVKPESLTGGGTFTSLFLYAHFVTAAGAFISNIVAQSVNNPALDVWQDLAGTVVAPANAANVKFLVTANNNSVATAHEWRTRELMLTRTPAPVAYGDGDTPGREWLGAAHASVSVRHEYPPAEVYGPAHALQDGAVPTLDNGVCHVRWVKETNSFAVDHWDGAAMLEQARFAPARGTSVTSADVVYPAPVGVDVIEWTPDRAVLRVTFADATTRCECYLTLDRSAAGPRVEVYVRGPGTMWPRLIVMPATAGAITYGTAAATGTLVSATSYSVGAAPHGWMRPPAPGEVLRFAVLQAAGDFTGAQAGLYGAARQAVVFRGPSGSVRGYFSALLDVAARGATDAADTADAAVLGRRALADVRLTPTLTPR